MIMKKWIVRLLAAIMPLAFGKAYALGLPVRAFSHGQPAETDKTTPEYPCIKLVTDTVSPDFAAQPVDENSRKYEISSRHYKKFWHALTPKRIVIQYAGGIGLLSTGVGWMYGKNKTWETDFLVGFVPPYSTGRAKATITLKETYNPFNVNLRKNVYYQPLACGLYLNSIMGHEFWTNEPSRYPKKYYGFSTAIRTGIFLGQRVKLKVPPSQRHWFKEIMLYYEANTCDLHIVSCATNKHISLWDIVNFSFGFKFTVF